MSSSLHQNKRRKLSLDPPVVASDFILLLEEMQKENAEDVVESLNILLNVMGDNKKKNIEAAFRLGAPVVVVLTMKRFKNHRDVQLYGCGCLRKLASLNKNVPTIIQTGGMDALVKAMNTFSHVFKVQQHGCGAIMNIFNELGYVNDAHFQGDFDGEDSDVETVDDGKDEVESTRIILWQASKRFVNDLDGLELTLAAMEKFFHKKSVVAFGCGIFCNLSRLSEFHVQMRAAGVMGAVGKASDKLYDDEGVSNIFSNNVRRCMLNML